LKKLAYALAFLFGVFAVAFLLLRTPDTNRQAMIEKYGIASSQVTDGADGLSVHYTDQGCRTCPALVFIHGGNASLHTILPVVDLLADRYRIIAYDQPSHGLTGPHPDDDYTAAGFISALEEVLDATGVEQFTLAGNSFGGWIAWRYALENPDRLTGLVLISAGGTPPPEDAEPAGLYLGARIIRHPIGRWFGRYITPRRIVKQSLFDAVADDDLVTDAMIDRYWELLRYPGNRRAAGLRAIADREPHYADQLGDITAPTLIMWGEEDSVTPLYNADTFHAAIPDSRKLVLPNVGHVPMEEVPQQTANAIDAFMSAHAYRSAPIPDEN